MVRLVSAEMAGEGDMAPVGAVDKFPSHGQWRIDAKGRLAAC